MFFNEHHIRTIKRKTRTHSKFIKQNKWANIAKNILKKNNKERIPHHLLKCVLKLLKINLCFGIGIDKQIQ